MGHNGRNKKLSFSKLESFDFSKGMGRTSSKRSQGLQQNFAREMDIEFGVEENASGGGW